MFKFSEEFKQKRLEDVDKAAEEYVSSLHNLLQSLDLTTGSGSMNAHNVLHTIEAFQKLHAGLKTIDDSDN